MPSLKRLYEKFDRKVHVISREIGANSSAKHYFELRKSQGLPIARLTADQKAQVNEVWKGKVSSKGFATHELVLSATGKFDPYICSELMFRTSIELALNNFQLKFGFSDKNYFDRMFPGEPMPTAVIRNINGVFLDAQYRQITRQDALKLMNSHEKLIAKPSIENGFGKSVSLYQNKDFERVFDDFKQNYIVQEVLTQHSSVSALNPTSINVVRVISLSLNGKVSPVNYALRCGAQGSITDNQITKDGRGMFVIGIKPDGTLKDEAYYSCGEKITVAPNGENFSGIKLPNFSDALKMTTRMHEAMPHFGFMGFDVCFDPDGSPRIMEMNIRGPGVLYYQYANGPLFAERTQEVIDTFCK